MNAKVFTLFLILVLVNVSIGIPLEGLVNEMDSKPTLTFLNETVVNGYYQVCWTVCYNGNCVQRCSN